MEIWVVDISEPGFMEEQETSLRISVSTSMKWEGRKLLVRDRIIFCHPPPPPKKICMLKSQPPLQGFGDLAFKEVIKVKRGN